MKLPLKINGLKGQQGKHRCTWCKKLKVCEPNSLAAIDCGAILIDPDTKDGGPDKAMEGYFSLTWHGAHLEDNGKGEYANIYCYVDIAKDVKYGQIGLLFCSTKCMRDFLNYAVDQLEEKRNKISKKREKRKS